MGTGVLILNGTLPDTLIEGGTGTFSEKIEQPEILPEMFESGTLNVPGIAGISAGADFIKSKGILWPLLMTGLFYLVFSGLLTLLFGRIEKKLSYFRS